MIGRASRPAAMDARADRSAPPPPAAIASVRLSVASILLTALFASSAFAAATDEAELKRLVDRVARAGDAERREAEERLIDTATSPLLKAIGPLETRSPAEQERLLGLLSRVSAKIRIALFRAGLSPDDRKRLDAMADYSPELVEQLFDDDPRRRKGAVASIPIEPNSGAGVLAIAKLHDWDEDVVLASFDVVRQLKDDVVARGLIRFVDDVTATIKSGHYGPGDQEIALTLVTFVGQAVKVLGELKRRDALPCVLAALDFYTSVPAYRNLFPNGDGAAGAIADALGEIGDPAAAPALLARFDNDELRDTVAVDGKLVAQTYGDAALLALLKIYRLEPAEYGVRVTDLPRRVAGFDDPATRDSARRRFKKWYDAHAGNAASTQPSGTTRP